MKKSLVLAAVLFLTGCEATPTLVGTWDGEMPPGQAVKTPKGDIRPNLVLELRANHAFHATMLVAVLDGQWEEQGSEVILHPQKATINGEDVATLRKQLEPMMVLLPPEERVLLQTYDPTRSWVLQIQNKGKTLFLPSQGEGIAAFSFHKAM